MLFRLPSRGTADEEGAGATELMGSDTAPYDKRAARVIAHGVTFSPVVHVVREPLARALSGAAQAHITDPAAFFVAVALLGDVGRFLTTVGLISGVQLLFTVLATLASGTSVGVVGTVKIIPQWLLAFTMDGASLDPRHFAGVCLVTASACAWAYSGGVSKSPPRLPSRVLFV